MDRKLITFLSLCKTMNYRASAEALHLTQPAITKQIQSLEAEYGIKLFTYDGRKLALTEYGKILMDYARSFEYNFNEMQSSLDKQKKKLHLRIGATKTIGDYVICSDIMKYLHDPTHELTLIVDNTEQLLKRINDSELDFAFIEGAFSKSKYHYNLLRREPFVGIRAKMSPTENRPAAPYKIEDLFHETIIVREKGSGTRELFERDLAELGYELSDFARVVELSSFHLICQAVAIGLGITFLYHSVIKDRPGFTMFSVDGICGEHEFNVVSLKNTSVHLIVERFLSETESTANTETMSGQHDE